jgi:serine/threonine protein kinase
MALTFNRAEVETWEKLNDHFRIDFKTTIGKGSYGVVYRGYSRARDNLIAIKVVKSTELSKREIDTLMSLSSLDHPNIMGFYGVIEKNENTFLLLEYCNRGTLAELIN